MEIIVFLLVVYVLYTMAKNKEKKLKGGHKSHKSENYFESDFTITTSYGGYNDSPKSKNKAKGRWIESGESVSFGNYDIKNGLFYFGGVLKGRYQGDVESSLVDETLVVAKAPYTYEDNSLDYWPSFNAISPKCRGAYLDWLSSNRDMSDVPIGYLYIYFYSLERRVLLDYSNEGLDEEELQIICNEVVRLRDIFKSNYSFLHYSTQLLSYIAIQYPDITDAHEHLSSQSSDLFKLRLAETVTQGQAIEAELALAWIYDHPNYSLRTPSRRCAEEYKNLFVIKYNKKLPDGIIVKPNKTPLKLHYNPANKSIDYQEYGPKNLCDPSILTAPLNKISKIAYECTDELDSLSRYLGRSGNSREDLNALLLLPDMLLEQADNSIIRDSNKAINEAISTNNGLIFVKDIWSYTGLPKPKKFNKKEIEIVESLLEMTGKSFAPNSNLHGTKFKFDDVVVVYECSDHNTMKNTPVFDDIAVKLRICSIIAHADSSIHSNEEKFLNNIVASNDNLTSIEKKSLEAFLKWLLISPSSFSGVKASLKSLRDKDLRVVRNMLINTALSDGRIDPDEVKNIEKLYTSLGLDKSDVPGDIHAISSNGNVITKSNNKSVKDKNVEFDSERLKKYEASTDDAKEILSQIFKDEEPVEEDENENSEMESSAVIIYKAIINEKITTLDRFQILCKDHDFFPQAAIDSINEWSFEKVDAPVIELNDNVVIDNEIAEELKEFI